MATTVERVVLELSSDTKGVQQGLDGVVARLKSARGAARDTGSGFSSLEGSWTKLAAAFGAGALFDRAVSGLVSMGRAAVNSAGQIVDLSDQTGLSTEAVQVYGAVAKQTGGDLSTYADAIFKLGINLAKGGDEAEDAVKRLGLDFQKLRAMKPEEQFEAIAGKLKNVTNEGDRNRLGVQLLGKTWKDVAAGVVAGVDDIRAATVIASDESVRAVDAATDAWDQFLTNTESRLTAFLGNAVIGFATLTGSKGGAFDSILSDILPPEVASLLLGHDVAPPKGRGKSTPGRTAADDARAEQHAKKMADEAERYTKAIQDLADELSGAKAYHEMIKLTDAVAGANAAGGIAVTQIPKIVEQIQAWKDAGLAIHPVLQDIFDAETRRATQAGRDFHAVLEDINGVANNIAITAARPELIKFIAGLAINMGAPRLGAHGEVGLGNEVPPKVLTSWEKYGGLIDLATDSMALLGRSTSSSFGTALQFGAQAIQMYAKVAGAAKDAASQAAAAQSAAMMGLGFFINGMIQVLQNIEEAKAKNRAMDRLWDDAGFSDTERLNIFDRLIDEAKQGSTELRDLLRQAGGDSVQAVSNWIQAFQGQIAGLLDSIESLGSRAPNALRPMIADLLQSTKLTAEHRAILEGMSEDTSWEDMQAAAERYGISLDALGAGFQLKRLGAQFNDLFVDFTNLTEGGADAGAVLRGMSDEMQALLNDAMRTGTALPEFIRPMLQSMADMGLLLDENGNALKDLSRFTFTDSIESSFARMADVLTEIRDLLRSIGAASLPSLAVPRAGLPSIVDPAVAAAELLRRQATGTSGGARILPMPMPGEVAARTDIKQYTGDVIFEVGGQRMFDISMEEMLRRIENNAGGGAPVGPNTRLRAALGVAA
jgi:hypothetical protein